MSQPGEQAPSAAEKTVWFQVVKDGKWHAAEDIDERQLFSWCGLIGIEGDSETVRLAQGVLPIAALPPLNDDVCLHCQRALEMARRDA